MGGAPFLSRPSCGGHVIMKKLNYLSASECLLQFREGRLSPVDYLESVIAAAKAQQPVINAASYMDLDNARAMAKRSAQRYRDGTARALEGIPIIVKEETGVAGWPRSYASLLHLGEIAEHTHPIVDKLLAAGAIPYFQATNPEFCVLGHTWSRRYGVTRNPWSHPHSCGGSSGGTAAALAAGVAPLGTGSDMAGSIRLPSAICGTYGFKPPFGRVPCAPGDEYFAQASEGPMARTIDDLILMQNVIAGPHPASYATIPFTPLPQTYPDLQGVRIAVSPTLGTTVVDDDVVRNLEHALKGLQARGAEIVPVNINWDVNALADELVNGILAIYFGEPMAEITDAEAEKLTSYARQIRDQAKGKKLSLAPTADLTAQLHAEMVEKVWSQGCDALICATTLTTRLAADQDPVKEPYVYIKGVPVKAELGWALTPPFSLLNRYPVLAAPTGLSDLGVPTGIQIVTNSYQDEMAFRIAYNHAQAGTSDLFVSRFPSEKELLAS